MKYYQIISTKFRHYPYLTIVAAIIAIGIGVFASILEDLYTKEPEIINFDLNITKLIVGQRTSFFNEVFQLFTSLANLVPFLILFSIVLVILVIYKRYISALTILLTVIGGQVIVYIIKALVERPRPDSIYSLIPEEGFSFPSGHTFVAVCFWGVLGFLVFKNIKNRTLRFLLIIPFLIIVLGIGSSRIYLGVHWFSDVFASYVLATVYCLAVVFIIRRRKKLFDRFR